MAGTIKTQEVYEKEEREEDLNKIEIQLPKKDVRRGSQNVVCEPSIDEKDEGEESSGDEFEANPQVHAYFYEKSRDGLEVSAEEQDKDLSTQAKKERAFSSSTKKLTKGNRAVNNYRSIHTEMGDHPNSIKKKLDMDGIMAHRRRSQEFVDRGSITNQDRTADGSCNVPLQTGISLDID